MALSLVLTMNLTLLLLFGFLFGLLAAVGYFFELSGFVIVLLAVFLVFIQWLIGPRIIWWTTNMRPLERSEYPWIWETVENICRKHKVPKPKLALARIGAPNAFVFGRTPGSATLVVTQGLLKQLTKDEVKAVIGHEIGHIRHKDMVVMTIVAIIPLIAYFIARFLIFAPSRSRDRKEASALIVVGLAAFLIYIISNLLVSFLSRLREYHADSFGGRATRPKLLASALAKITYGLSVSGHKEELVARSFYIADPINAAHEVTHFKDEYSDFDLTDSELNKAMEWEKTNIFARITEVFSSHPRTFKRIHALVELDKKLSSKPS